MPDTSPRALTVADFFRRSPRGMTLAGACQRYGIAVRRERGRTTRWRVTAQQLTDRPWTEVGQTQWLTCFYLFLQEAQEAPSEQRSVVITSDAVRLVYQQGFGAPAEGEDTLAWWRQRVASDIVVRPYGRHGVVLWAPEPVPAANVVPVSPRAPRAPGVVYWGAGVTPHILDPICPWPAITAGGVRCVAVDGTMHIYETLNRAEYPNAADFIEEMRAHGVSRRLPITRELRRLSSSSRWLFLHPRAVIKNWSAYRHPGQGVVDGVLRDAAPCPTNEASHAHLDEDDDPCAALWWEDIDPTTVATEISGRQVVVQTARGVSYTGFRRPAGVVPVYALGVLAYAEVGSLDRLEVIDTPTRPAIVQGTLAALRAQLPSVRVGAPVPR